MRKQVIEKARRQSIAPGALKDFKDVNTNLQGALKHIKDHGHEHDHKGHHNKCFINTKNGADSVVEPIISLWKITKLGQLQ
jgi:hypothetical protein